MQAYILQSNTGTRFRFGEALGAYSEESHNAQKTTSDYLHSDTLWSALVSAWALSCPNSLVDFLSACENGKFKLSSAFYAVNFQKSPEVPNGNIIYFLPKPTILNLRATDKPKELKRIKFISKGIWEQGVSPENWFDKSKCTLLQNDSIVALKSEISKSINLFSITTNHKNRARDVTNREDAFYYETDLFLLGNEEYKTDWYFLVENNLSNSLQSDFDKSLQTMIHFGIGGERTAGCGSLTNFKLKDFDLKIEKLGNCLSSLSLVAPQENELSENSLYQVIKRGGRFLEQGKSLPMIQMLLEGAVFDKEIEGRIVRLNANPPILRYGLNFSIPLHNGLINNEL